MKNQSKVVSSKVMPARKVTLILAGLVTLLPCIGSLSPAQAKPPSHAPAYGYRAKQTKKWRKKQRKREGARYNARRYNTQRDYDRNREYDRSRDYNTSRDYDPNQDFDYPVVSDRATRRQQQIEAATSILGGFLSR